MKNQAEKKSPQRRSSHSVVRRFEKSAAILLLLVVIFSSRPHATVSAVDLKTTKNNAQSEEEYKNDYIKVVRAPWQACEAFMAPTNTSTGWGVFANRDFEEGELVDITPLHFYMKSTDDAALSSPTEHRVVRSTSLDDYVYGTRYTHLNKHETNILFGYEMMYNHHPTDSNIVLALSAGGYVHGCYTTRRIRAGEEILSSYSSSDAGKAWFAARNMTMSHDRAIIASPEQLDYLSSEYCTKIYAGAGPETFERLFPSIDESRVAPFEAGLNDARAKVPIKAGERIEQAPAMLLYKPFVKNTALAPLVITWDDMLSEHRDSMISASAPILEGKLPIEYSGPASQWKRIRRMTSLENVAILPFAGRIAMVRRVVKDTTNRASSFKSNCRLDISIKAEQADHDDDVPPRVSVVLELIATEYIPTGQVLLMDLKPAGTVYERELLKAKLLDIGHPFDLQKD